MAALLRNTDIFSNVNMSKYKFILSTNVSTLTNFALSVLVFFPFAAIDYVVFHLRADRFVNFPPVCRRASPFPL